MYPQQPGTYCFLNTANNKVYVGSAQCLNTRLIQHLKNKSSNQLLQDSIAKRGLKAYIITYVITETHAEALMQEQLMLDYLFQNNVPKYNIHDKAIGGCAGSKEKHQNLCEKGGGAKAKIRFALDVNNPDSVQIFKSSVEASLFTGVSYGNVSSSCKTAKPENGNSRWLFSDVSIEDLKTKFNKLTKNNIKGLDNSRDKTKGFMLINKFTKEMSQVFYSVYDPQKQGYKINHSNLSSCLLGKLKTVNGYYVALCI